MEFILLKAMFGIDLPDLLPAIFSFYASPSSASWKNIKTHFLKRKGNKFSYVCVYARTHIHMFVCIYIYIKTSVYICMLKTLSSCNRKKVLVKTGDKKGRKKKYRLGETEAQHARYDHFIIFYSCVCLST